MEIKAFRKQWNQNQKELRQMLAAGVDLPAAKELFYKQHQPLHSTTGSGTGAWSYADEVFSDLEEKEFREILPGEEHSLLWILWHITRIEDITMRILVEDGEQEYLSGGWFEKLASPVHHTGNDAPQADILSISRGVDPQALLDYRNAVGKNTRKLVKVLGWEDLRDKVAPERLDRLVAEGAVLPEAEGVLAYWGKRIIYELLLMPPTRHLLVHLNQAWEIKSKLRKR